ncbi:MAG: formate--tetrahydrofolate ligase, partial [Nitrososphaerota archaeon]|nr:formate--tetrahydrofolate ligase [Nitrososphaerota archaeon]
MRPVEDVLSDLGIGLDLATLYGRYKAKVSLRALDGSSRGKLVLVTGITPTPHGEGKTVVSVGLGMGL